MTREDLAVQIRQNIVSVAFDAVNAVSQSHETRDLAIALDTLHEEIGALIAQVQNFPVEHARAG